MINVIVTKVLSQDELLGDAYNMISSQHNNCTKMWSRLYGNGNEYLLSSFVSFMQRCTTDVIDETLQTTECW